MTAARPGFSPVVALALRALTCVLKAKTGQLRDCDRLDLLRDVLSFAGDDAGWRAAALLFEDRSRDDPAGAARALEEWVSGAGSAVLGEGAAETALAANAADPAWAHHPWMDRADING